MTGTPYPHNKLQLSKNTKQKMYDYIPISNKRLNNRHNSKILLLKFLLKNTIQDSRAVFLTVSVHL